MKKGMFLIVIVSILYVLPHMVISHYIVKQSSNLVTAANNGAADFLQITSVELRDFKRKGTSLYSQVTLVQNSSAEGDIESATQVYDITIEVGPLFLNKEFPVGLAKWEISETMSDPHEKVDQSEPESQWVANGNLSLGGNSQFTTYMPKYTKTTDSYVAFISENRGGGFIKDGQLVWNTKVESLYRDSGIEDMQINGGSVHFRLGISSLYQGKGLDFDFSFTAEETNLTNEKQSSTLKGTNLSFDFVDDDGTISIQSVDRFSIVASVQQGQGIQAGKLPYEVDNLEISFNGKVNKKSDTIDVEFKSGIERFKYDNNLEARNLTFNTHVNNLDMGYMRYVDGLKADLSSKTLRDKKIQQYIDDNLSKFYDIVWSISDISGTLSNAEKTGSFQGSGKLTMVGRSESVSGPLSNEAFLELFNINADFSMDKAFVQLSVHESKRFDIENGPGARYLSPERVDELAELQTGVAIKEFEDKYYFRQLDDLYELQFLFGSGRSYINGSDINYPYRPATR